MTTTISTSSLAADIRRRPMDTDADEG